MRIHPLPRSPQGNSGVRKHEREQQFPFWYADCGKSRTCCEGGLPYYSGSSGVRCIRRRCCRSQGSPAFSYQNSDWRLDHCHRDPNGDLHGSAYQPDYSGDGSYSGNVQYGTEYDNEIDISDFIDPESKNNHDLAAYAIQAWENNWGYVWGTYGNVLTESLFEYKKEQYPDGVGDYADFIEENWLGRRTADCVGLVKGYGWLDTSNMTIDYAKNGMPDYGANQMYQAAKDAGVLNADYGSLDTMPEVVGLMLWKKGHVGVYIGNGYVIEAMGTRKGVVKTELAGRGWQGWCKLPYINYLEVE